MVCLTRPDESSFNAFFVHEGGGGSLLVVGGVSEVKASLSVLGLLASFHGFVDGEVSELQKPG